MTGIKKTPDVRLNRKGKYVLGLDLGGTKFAVGLVDLKGKVLHSIRKPTRLDSGPEGVCKQMLETSEMILSENKIDLVRIIGAGIGAGGPLDLEKGTIITAPNLPGFRDFPIKHKMEKCLRMKVVLDNDANAAALGEKMFGAGREVKNLIYVTVSTGVGGGIIINGKLFHGFKGAAGEVGHMTLKPDGPACNCGNRGCLEALSSGTAIARTAKKAVRKNPASLMLDLAEGEENRINAKVVFRAADRGDIVANRIIDNALFYLGVGIGNLITAFSPEMVILGGGLTESGSRLFNSVRAAIRERVKLVPADLIQVVRAGLGKNSGIVGAASLVITRLKKDKKGL